MQFSSFPFTVSNNWDEQDGRDKKYAEIQAYFCSPFLISFISFIPVIL